MIEKTFNVTADRKTVIVDTTRKVAVAQQETVNRVVQSSNNTLLTVSTANREVTSKKKQVVEEVPHYRPKVSTATPTAPVKIISV